MAAALITPIAVTLTNANQWYEIDTASPGGWPDGKVDAQIMVRDGSTPSIPLGFDIALAPNSAGIGDSYQPRQAGAAFTINSCGNIGRKVAGAPDSVNPFKVFVRCATAGAKAIAFISQESV